MITDFFAEVEKELNRANKIFDPFHSLHEGYAVILEEVEELWGEIKDKKSTWDCQVEELIQVMAMCVKLRIYLEAVKDVSKWREVCTG